MDRNRELQNLFANNLVALRKESVDRNLASWSAVLTELLSLSARRAWIEIIMFVNLRVVDGSLSARRAWIEILAWGLTGGLS